MMAPISIMHDHLIIIMHHGHHHSDVRHFGSDPDTPPPQSLGAGTGPPVGNFFLKPQHMCVQNDQRDEGIILRYVFWGTPPPRTAASTPPSQGPKGWGGGVLVSGLSLNAPHVLDTNQWSVWDFGVWGAGILLALDVRVVVM